MEIKKLLTTINRTKTDNRQIKYIVIHYTGNANDTALNNCKYFETMDRGASAHYFVDENEVYQCVEDEDVAWAVGRDYSNGKAAYWNKVTNYNSISIEMCNSMVYNEVVEKKTLELTKELMKKYNIPADNVLRHYDVCGKQCPLFYANNPSAWLSFKKKLKEEDKEVLEAIDILADAGAIKARDFWRENWDSQEATKYIRDLIINCANVLHK